MNGYKKVLLGLAGVSIAAHVALIAKPQKTYPRSKAIGGLVGNLVNLYLVWNA